LKSASCIGHFHVRLDRALAFIYSIAGLASTMLWVCSLRSAFSKFTPRVAFTLRNYSSYNVDAHDPLCRERRIFLRHAKNASMQKMPSMQKIAGASVQMM